MFAGRNPERDTLIIYGFLCVRFRLSQEFINNALQWPIPCTILALSAKANIDITCGFLIFCDSFEKKRLLHFIEISQVAIYVQYTNN